MPLPPQVFGRCIAGDGCGGNMGYFKGLIMMGLLGCATCVSFMFVTASSVSHPTKYAYGGRGYHYPGTG